MAAYQIAQTISDPGTAPQRTDPDNFDTRADAFLTVLSLWGAATTGELIVLTAQMNALSTAVDGYSTDAETAQTAAELAQTAAEAAEAGAIAASNVSVYAGGTTYAAGDFVLDSADNYKMYTSQAGSNTGNTPNSDDGSWWLPSIITPRVITKTSSDTLTTSELSGLTTIDNNGAGAEVIMTWAALVNAQECTFYVTDAQYLQIKVPAGSTIRNGSDESADNGYIRSTTVGDWVHIKAMPDGLVVMGFNLGGTWLMDE
jgi:hypothetical protein